MNLSAFIISQVRTYVPLAVGALLTWLAATLGVVVTDSSRADVIALCVAVVSAVYYLLVRLLEKKWPKLGIFLGVAAKPVYPSA